MAVTAQNVAVGIVGGSDLVKLTEALGEGSESQPSLHMFPKPLQDSTQFHCTSPFCTIY